MVTRSLICAAFGCDASIADMRIDALYCSTRCRMRGYRSRLRPHPYRGTPQYKEMRDMWPEYVGYHWLSERGEHPGSWDRFIRRTRSEYATAGWD